MTAKIVRFDCWRPLRPEETLHIPPALRGMVLKRRVPEREPWEENSVGIWKRRGQVILLQSRLPLSNPPDFTLFFASVARTHVEPHPMAQVFKAFIRAFWSVCGAMRYVMAAYLVVVTLIAVPWAIIEGRWLLAGFCGSCGVGIAWGALQEIRFGRVMDIVRVRALAS